MIKNMPVVTVESMFMLNGVYVTQVTGGITSNSPLKEAAQIHEWIEEVKGNVQSLKEAGAKHVQTRLVRVDGKKTEKFVITSLFH